ncbi:MAG: hydrogenase small subunit [Firmicutes bacterium]|nr:hydrogenase small subunit [Bacillota bacterium]
MLELSEIFGKKFSRRDFLKYSSTIAVLLGLSEAYVPRIADALETITSKKQPVIWLNGSGCTGCTVSFANSRYPTVSELVLDTISVKYNETLMAASGEVAEKALEDAVNQFKGKYIMVVEGAIPTKENGIYCKSGGKTFLETVKMVAKGAAYNVAVGTCASFGGIPAAQPNPTGCKGLKDVIGGTVLNIPGCPPHPDWVVGSLVNILMFGKVPALDEHGRPEMFYGKVIHENCPRRGAYEQGSFVKNFGVALTNIEGCMGAKGCRGPIAHADCPQRLWNSGVNFCIGASAPCAGCTEPDFPRMLLFEPIPEVTKQIEAGKEGAVGTFGASLGGAVAGAAVAAGAMYLAREKNRQSSEGKKEV